MKQFKMVSIVSNPRLSVDTVSISAKLASEYDTEEMPQIVLKVGQLRKSLKLRINQKVNNKNVISLNPSTMRRMLLSSGRKYGVYIGEGEIKLGPVVGIMAESSADSNRPFFGQSYFFKQMITYGRRLGQICFGFNINGIHWHNKTISGWTVSGGRWVRSTFPMPDVVYPRHKGYSGACMRARRGLQSHGVAISNPPLIGKWQTYKILSENPDLLDHIPDTALINSLKQVDTMINKYHGVYIKPVNGSLGRNIIKVVKSPKGKRYIYQYRRSDGVYRGSASSIAALRRKLRSIMGRRHYIIQKQINLIRSGGNILDVRVLIQKDDTGESSITGMACRVGRSGAITSNISSGGYAKRVNQVLRSRFQNEEKVNEIIETIRRVALDAARTLENNIGPVGEMGVDIGVDRDGNIWFIEANLKPGRQVFSLLHQTRTRMMTIYKPLLYARYLAGFK